MMVSSLISSDISKCYFLDKEPSRFCPISYLIRTLYGYTGSARIRPLKLYKKPKKLGKVKTLYLQSVSHSMLREICESANYSSGKLLLLLFAGIFTSHLI